MPRTSTKQILQDRVDIFNDEVEVGDTVCVKKDFSSEGIITKTKSEAYVLGEHSAVVMLEGISGCHLLDRVCKVTLPVYT